MAQDDDERTPLLNHGVEESGNNDAEDATKKNPDNPANLSKSKVATILAANWVCILSRVASSNVLMHTGS